MKNKEIALLASKATDILVDISGNILSRQAGGPFYYITQVLEQKNLPFESRDFPALEVEVLVTPDTELGRVKEHPLPNEIPALFKDAEIMVISTILNEINLSNLKDYKGKVFLDVQGYVRDGQDFGKKKYWDVDKSLFDTFFCLKGTEEELSFIPNNLLKFQKQKVLIVTKGKEGGEVYLQGSKQTFQPALVAHPKNTLGAGDTFFAHFVSDYIKSSEISASIASATSNTTNFLIGQSASIVNNL